jgi:dynein heavy chain
MGGENLKVIRLSQSDYLRNLETGIIAGIPVLLENIGETIDPVLDTLLSTKKGSTETIKLGDR